jgi:hypothetical protein
MAYVIVAVLLVVAGSLIWNMTARAAYESAEYTVVESEGDFEIREYPDLMLVTTDMRLASQGGDGSFMRLFRYISGANESDQKVAMTTPVFMEETEEAEQGRMAFVLPKDVVSKGVPKPKGNDVHIRKRRGGRFGVLRFAGRMDSSTAEEAEERLRTWLEDRGLPYHDEAEFAGYDPPWTPGPLRRNEILFRLESDVKGEAVLSAEETAP